ncbi:MAG: ATP-binding protein [Nitrospirota bacterium]
MVTPRLRSAAPRGPFRAFQRLHLTTKLLLMMGVLTVLSLGSVFLFYAYNERLLIREITENVNDLSSAIQISGEELTSQASTNEGRLQDYVGRLTKKGVREISIISNSEKVIASSNPTRVGQKINPHRKDLFITARLGEGNAEGVQTHNLLVPIVVDKQQVGYAHIMLVMDDYERLLRTNLIKRLMVTGGIFGLGAGLVLFLSWRYTRPIYQVVAVAKQVAAGNLSATLPQDRGDEIGELIASVNEMVDRLREQRALEDRLREAERFSALGQLAAGIAHEIRNPLNFISLSLDRVRDLVKREDGGRSDEIPALLGSIKGEVFRLNRLIDSFLKYGRPVKLARQWVSVRALLDDVIALVRPKADEARVALSVDGESLPPCFVDPEQITRCVMNVMLNAFQSMPDGGRLRVVLALEPGGDESVGRFVRLAIGDTGAGIGEEDLSRVFEPYFTTKKLGIGLGLALTKQIIEEHGGTIAIASRIGEGTTVSMRVPVGRDEARG